MTLDSCKSSLKNHVQPDCWSGDEVSRRWCLSRDVSSGFDTCAASMRDTLCQLQGYIMRLRDLLKQGPQNAAAARELKHMVLIRVGFEATG